MRLDLNRELIKGKDSEGKTDMGVKFYEYLCLERSPYWKIG